MALHVDTDFLIYALGTAGLERLRLLQVAESNHALCISAVAWYEFSRGPRTPEQLATVRALFAEDCVIPFSEPLAATPPKCSADSVLHAVALWTSPSE